MTYDYTSSHLIQKKKKYPYFLTTILLATSDRKSTRSKTRRINVAPAFG